MIQRFDSSRRQALKLLSGASMLPLAAGGALSVFASANAHAAGKVTGGLHEKVAATLDPLVKANYRDRYGAAVGYLTGLPTPT